MVADHQGRRDRRAGAVSANRYGYRILEIVRGVGPQFYDRALGLTFTRL
jgi:hypothetical protein